MDNGIQLNSKVVWQCDSEGYLVSLIELSKQNGDWGKSGWLIPAGCVEIEPPTEREGFVLKWLYEQWEYEEIIPEENIEAQKSPQIDPQENLNREFIEEKEELLKAYLTAELYEDDDLRREIRLELQELEIKYSEEMEQIKTEEDLKEVSA